MKQKLLSLLVLLMTAATSAWADGYLYLEIDPSDNTSATMKYGMDYDGKPYYDERADWWYDEYEWNGKGTIKTITVDASCQNADYSNLSRLFCDFTGLETINNAGNLNTSKVQDMSRMFVNCEKLTTLNLGGWDTSKVTDMLSMFDGCLALTTLNIGGWDTGELTNTQGMFENCVNLKYIYVGAGWSTTKVTNDVGMFYGCENLPNWDGTTDVSKAYVGDGGYLTSNMKTIYCKMEYGWWTDGNVGIGIYTWGESGEKAALPGERMTLADGETDIWKFDLDVAAYKMCIFTRVNGSGNISYLNAKTKDLTIPTDDKNMFTITNNEAVWGDPGCDGTWSKYVAPKFIITGSMTNWDENMIKVYADSYTFESLYPGKYQFKVIDNGSRKGIDDMTEVAGGLYKDQDGNVCFILNDISNVTVNYKSGELFTVDVEIEDRLVAPEIKLIGINGWNDPADAIVLTPAADKKSASVTMTLDAWWYDFKVIRADEWLGKENEGTENYKIHSDWNWVDGLVRDYTGLKAISLQPNEVNKNYTFTYDYAAGKLTVNFPGVNTITINDGNKDAANWEADPTEQYAGEKVTLKYNGKKKVKNITIVAAPVYKMAADATVADKGKLICTAGHIHAYGEDVFCTKDRVAKIIYIGTTGDATYNHGLALALADEGSTMTWSDACTACNTTKNTSTPVTAATWLLASKDQWDYMMGSNGAGSYTALRDGFNSVGGSNLQSNMYWSSTESESDSSQAWYHYFYSDNWWYWDKNSDYYVRACLAF